MEQVTLSPKRYSAKVMIQKLTIRNSHEIYPLLPLNLTVLHWIKQTLSLRYRNQCNGRGWSLSAVGSGCAGKDKKAQTSILSNVLQPNSITHPLRPTWSHGRPGRSPTAIWGLPEKVNVWAISIVQSSFLHTGKFQLYRAKSCRLYQTTGFRYSQDLIPDGLHIENSLHIASHILNKLHPISQ